MPTKKATVARVVKPRQAPGARGAKNTRHYGVAYRLSDGVIEVRRVVSKKMKPVGQ